MQEFEVVVHVACLQWPVKNIHGQGYVHVYHMQHFQFYMHSVLLTIS